MSDASQALFQPALPLILLIFGVRRHGSCNCASRPMQLLLIKKRPPELSQVRSFAEHGHSLSKQM
jgi:hypothetical protein